MRPRKQVSGEPDAIFAIGRFYYLVEAALRAEKAPDSWEDYRQALGTRTPNSGEVRLYPLVAENLKNSGKPSQDHMIVAAQRTAIAQGEIMLRAAEYANRCFQKSGIQVVFVKGTALQIAEYRNPSLRTFADIDCCIHPNDIAAVTRVAEAEGWINYKNFVPQNAHTIAAHAEMTFQLPSGVSLDVHWTPRRVFSFQPELVKHFFETTETVAYRGQKWRIPSASWRLVETIEHGMEANSVLPIRWVTDAVRLLENPSNHFNWDWIANTAREARIEMLFREALNHLTEFSTSVTDNELSKFVARPSRLEEWEFRRRMKITGGAANRLWREFLHFFLRAPGNLFARLFNFPSFLIKGAGRSEGAVDLIFRVTRSKNGQGIS